MRTRSMFSFGCAVYFTVEEKDWLLWFSMGITQIDIEILFVFICILPFVATYCVLYVLIYEKAYQLYSKHNEKQFQSVLQRRFFTYCSISLRCKRKNNRIQLNYS